jgi:hypothetical protein
MENRGARHATWHRDNRARLAFIQAGLELSLCLQPALASAIRRTAVVIDYEYHCNRRATRHHAETKGIFEKVNEGERDPCCVIVQLHTDRAKIVQAHSSDNIDGEGFSSSSRYARPVAHGIRRCWPEAQATRRRRRAP